MQVKIDGSLLPIHYACVSFSSLPVLVPEMSIGIRLWYTARPFCVSGQVGSMFRFRFLQ
jgi:hypothetical protein